MFSAIIVAGGQGSRSGLDQPKQFAKLNDRPLLWWSARAFASHPGLSRLVVVIPAGLEADAAQALDGLPALLVTGGGTRQQSVSNGLRGLDDDGAPLVFVHDAARPGVDHGVIDRLIEGLTAHESTVGAVPVLPVADTLVTRGGHRGMIGPVVDRSAMLRVQTPQLFRHDALRRAHAHAADAAATDDAQMVRAMGGEILAIDGDARLDKVTLPGDLTRIAALLSGIREKAMAQRPSVGMGYDVHRLVPGDGVWLGGVHVPHSQRLHGHSDADVVLHAITDAVLGTISDGDIGTHFPPSDPQWRGAASDQFLAHACMRVRDTGGVIEHVDCTVICEEPKIGPHRAAIRSRIAAIMNLPMERVSLKATTTERLGFTGRGEGIAAQAIVTASLPMGPA